MIIQYMPAVYFLRFLFLISPNPAPAQRRGIALNAAVVDKSIALFQSFHGGGGGQTVAACGYFSAYVRNAFPAESCFPRGVTFGINIPVLCTVLLWVTLSVFCLSDEYLARTRRRVFRSRRCLRAICQAPCCSTRTTARSVLRLSVCSRRL